MPTVTITQPPVLEDLNWFTMNWQGDNSGAGPWPTIPFGTPTPSFAGPWEFGGKLYCVGHGGLVIPHPPPDFPSPPFPTPEDPKAFGPFTVFASADGGATWSAPDVANRPYIASNPVNSPPPPTGMIYHRIANTIHFTMLVPGTMLPPWVSVNAWVVAGTFDLVTETYGALTTYDTGWTSFGNGVFSPAAVFLWPVWVAGALVFVGQDVDNGLFFGDPNLGKGRLLAGPAAGAYAALTDITPAPFTGAHFTLTVLSVQVDGAGIAHIVFSSLSTAPGADAQFWYMRLYPDLHTDAFQQLVVPSPPGVTPTFGGPAFSGSDILLPVSFSGNSLGVFRIINYSSILPATSYTAIVLGPWAVEVRTSAAVVQGARSVLFWCGGIGMGDTEIDYTYNDGAGWSVGAQFCDGSLIVIPAGDYNNNGRFETMAVALLSNGDFGILSGSRWQQFNAPFFFGNGNMFLAGNLGAAPPPPNPPILNQSSRRMTVLVPNRWDGCLSSDTRLHQLAGPQRSCCHDMVYSDIINVRAPKNSIPFRKVGAIPTPLAISGDVVVLDFQVPQGYDGLIAGLFHLYTGPGFREGNGDIEWRVLINKTYAVHLGQVLVTLGSRQQSYPVEGGIQIQSGQRIRYIVSVPNGSGGILPLASQIVCGLEGLFYARQ
jgi:hypothetical protein